MSDVPELVRKLKERYAGHTGFPWTAPLDEYGCHTIKGNKAGKHKQAQYQTEIASTWGLYNEDEEAANTLLLSESGDVHKLLEMAIVACEATLENCHNCYKGGIYGQYPEDGPEDICPVCGEARYFLGYVDAWLSSKPGSKFLWR